MEQSVKAADILEVRHVTNYYAGTGSSLLPGRHRHRVLNDVSLTIHNDEFFGLVGESGSGKSTLANCILGLIPYEGEIFVAGKPSPYNEKHRTRGQVLEYTRNVQAIFQDPLSALDPGKTISFTLQEPLKAHSRYLAEKGIIRNREDREKRVREVLSLCDLDPSYADRRPGGLSGGQRQRVCIAASLMLSPPLILADEAISALDVSVGSQILNLFRDIDEKADFAMLFISHNLNVVYYLCDRIAVLFNGQIVEQGDSEQLYSDPKHPYTQLLLSAVPGLGKSGTENGQDTGAANAGETKTSGGAESAGKAGTEGKTEGPGKAEDPRRAEAGEAQADAEEDGCPYAARCPKATAACREKIPLKDISVRQADGTVKEHMVRCVLA